MGLERLTPEVLSAALDNVRERMDPEIVGAVERGTSSPPVGEEQVCPTCNGAGWLRLDRPPTDPDFAKLVRCPDCGAQRERAHHAAASERISRECGLAKAQRAFNFDGFQPYDCRGPDGVLHSNREALRAAVAFSETGMAARAWLALAGEHGTGKTHLAAAIANALISQGVAVFYGYVPELLDWLREGYQRKEQVRQGYVEGDGGFEERWGRVRSAELLILDDLGSQSNTAWAVERLESLVDYRYRERLPLVVTTNEDPTRVKALSERIYSRLERYEPHATVISRVLPYHEWRRQQSQGEEIPW